jgi:hypothetical protein
MQVAHFLSATPTAAGLAQVLLALVRAARKSGDSTVGIVGTIGTLVVSSTWPPTVAGLVAVGTVGRTVGK